MYSSNVMKSGLSAASSAQQMFVKGMMPFFGVPFDLDGYMRDTNNLVAHSSDIVSEGFKTGSNMTDSVSKIVFGNGQLKPVSEMLDMGALFFKELRRPIRECKDLYEVGSVNDGVNASKVVFNLDDRVILKDYTAGRDVKNPNRAVILGNPFAGHGDIVDYRDEEHSLVSRFLSNYDGRVLAMCSPNAKTRHKNYSFEDEILNCNKATKFVANEIGGPVDFMAMCSRGKTLYCAASLEGELYRNLGVAGSPLDMDLGDAAIVEIAKSLPMDFYESLGNMHNGVVPGSYILSGFLGMQPELMMGGFDVQLFNNIVKGDLDRIEDRAELIQWYFNCIALPQRQYVEECALFKYNSMVKGDVIVDDRIVDFSKLNHKEHRLGGKKDAITPWESCCNVETGSSEVDSQIVNAGHFGLYTSPKVLNSYWKSKALELNYN